MPHGASSIAHIEQVGITLGFEAAKVTQITNQAHWTIELPRRQSRQTPGWGQLTPASQAAHAAPAVELTVLRGKVSGLDVCSGRAPVSATSKKMPARAFKERMQFERPFTAARCGGFCLRSTGGLFLVLSQMLELPVARCLAPPLDTVLRLHLSPGESGCTADLFRRLTERKCRQTLLSSS